MKVIFLDIDGVLNSNEFWVRRHMTGVMFNDRRDLFENNIDPLAVARLNCIIDETGAKVVISSTWRKYKTCDEMQAMLDDKGFIGEVIGRTEDFWSRPDLIPEPVGGRRFSERPFDRGHEIRHWLLENRDGMNITSYVVLDDNSDMATVEHRFVQTDPTVGLSDLDVERALEMLSIEGVSFSQMAA